MDLESTIRGTWTLNQVYDTIRGLRVYDTRYVDVESSLRYEVRGR